MLLKISLLKCIYLLNLSTIYCFNVIMMKDLDENQLVNKLSQITNQGEYDNVVHNNVNSIFVRSQRKRNPSVSDSEEDEKEESDNSKRVKVEIETIISDAKVPISNSTMKKHSKYTPNNDAINPENSSETKDKKPTKRTKKHKKHHKKDDESNEDEEKSNAPDISDTIKTLWDTMRSWFRRNNVSGNEKVRSLIDDQNLIDAMKKIIVIMRASKQTAKKPSGKQMLDPFLLRTERSGEEHDPLAPGKLPSNLMNLFTSTSTPKTLWYKPNSFWNYWTYQKQIHTDNCDGEGLVQYGNICIDAAGH